MVARLDQLGAQLIVRPLAAWLSCAALVAACGGRAALPALTVDVPRADSLVVERTDGTVDSAMTRSEALRRLAVTFPQPQALAGGAATREALVAEIGRALSARDTTALVRLSLSPSEWFFLYYPQATSRSLPPTMGPRQAWYIVAINSNQGAKRLLDASTTDAWTVLGHRCDGEDWTEGPNRVSAPCVLRVARGARHDTVEVAFANQLIERDGQVKIVSFARDAELPRASERGRLQVMGGARDD